MFIIRDTFATVWDVEDKGSYVQGRISTSEKDTREEGKYINSNWFARFVGKSKEKALALSTRDRIKILTGKVTNVLVGEGENRRSFLNVTIFDFEPLNNAQYQKPKEPVVVDDDELPF